MSNHTEGPWHAPGLAEVHDANHRCIAICVDCDPVPEDERPVPDVEEGDAIASRIVKAVNCHDELLEALRDMLAGWKYIRSFHGDLYGVGWDRAQDKAEAALAKATGEAA